MIRVGVTGGIGSGKTHICSIFFRMNIPVYNADTEAKKLADHDPEIKEEIISLLSRKVYTKTGLNRPLLADMIFRDSGLLEKINAIIHPRVAVHFKKWGDEKSSVPYIIQESAILFESNAYTIFDKIIVVFSPDEIRLRRLLQRENMTSERIQAIMSNQISEQEKIQRADYIVYNDEKQLVIPQVLNIHTKLLELC
jgi:dephospho-CoA kinase